MVLKVNATVLQRGLVAGRQRVALLLAAVSLLSVDLAAAQEWAQFRGPGAAGVVADNPNLPERWSADENVAWRTPIPGLGWRLAGRRRRPRVRHHRRKRGRRGVARERLVPRRRAPPPPRTSTTGSSTPLDLETGETRWRTEIHAGVPRSSHHLKNTFASETPVTDGEHLYVLFGNVGFYALGFDGTVRWSRDLPPAETRNGWGTASSPVLHDGRVYLVVDNEEQSYLAALSAETGAELWRADRDEGSNWSTPFVWEHDGRTEIVTTGTDRVRSYDLAGRELWGLSGMSSIVIPTPVTAHGLLYLESGYIADFFRPVYAIRPGASGDISLAEGETANQYVAWSLEQGGSYHPSPLVYGDYYYTLLDRGMMTAHDARTGAEVYGRRRIDVGHAFTASPWAYNGKIFALSEQGTTYVIEAGPEFRVLAENPLDEFTMATPAILDDSLVIRTADAVYRIAGP